MQVDGQIRCFSGTPESEFFCLRVDMRWMAGVDCFASGIGGCPSISETNCPKNGIRNGLWSDIRFRVFSGIQDWPAVCATAGKTSTSGDIEVSTKRPKNGDSCRIRMSDRRIGRWCTNVIGVHWVLDSARNRKSKTGYFAPETCPSQACRVKGVSQQARMKHKKCRVLPSGKRGE